jgi:hypothetical protein
MAKTLTATDRSALIRLASTMGKGSPERKAILKGLSKVSARKVPWVATVSGKKYRFRFDDEPRGGDPQGGLDYFKDNVYDGGPSGTDWDLDGLTEIRPRHWR